MSIKQISAKKWLIDYALRDELKKQHRIQKVVYGPYEAVQQEYQALKEELFNRVVYKKESSTKQLTMLEMGKHYLDYQQEMGKCMWGAKRNVKYAIQYFGSETLVKDLKSYQLIDYRKWHKERNPKIKEATINRAMACLRSMINRSVEFEWGGLQESPIKKYPMVHENRVPKGYLTPVELQSIIDNADNELRDIIYTLIYTGNRKNEVLNLRWDQINFETRLLTFKTKDSKRQGRILTKPISDQLLLLFSRRKKSNLFLKSEYVFPDSCNPAEPRKCIRTAWDNACKRAGIVDATPHILRHTFASWLVMETGGDMKVVSRLIGHSGIQITNDYYAHLSEDYLRSKINIIGDLLPMKNSIGS